MKISARKEVLSWQSLKSWGHFGKCQDYQRLFNLYQPLQKVYFQIQKNVKKSREFCGSSGSPVAISVTKKGDGLLSTDNAAVFQHLREDI